MKAEFTSFAFLFLLTFALLAFADDKEEEQKKAFEECIKITSVDEKCLENLSKGNLDDDEKLKETLFCVGKKLGYQNEDGTLKLKEIQEGVAEDAGDRRFDADVEKCSHTEAQGGPNIAFAVTKCMMDIYEKIEDKQD